MNIKSTSIADYIELNYDIETIKDSKELEKVEELVINNLDYSLEQAPFYPNELTYFTNLKKCTFMNFEITDEIINILNNLKLQVLTLDNCTCITDVKLNAEKIIIEVSRVNLETINSKDLTLIECGKIDINKNTKKLTILNCNIKNATQLKQLKCQLIGCALDDTTITNLENIICNPKQYKKII